MTRSFSAAALLLLAVASCQGLAPQKQASNSYKNNNVQPPSRRAALGWLGQAAAFAVMVPPSLADEMNVEDFLKKGGVSMPMGVSGQAGKMRPETGVVLR